MFQREFGAILEPVRGKTRILDAKKVLRVLKLKVSKDDHSSTSEVWHPTKIFPITGTRYFGIYGKLEESRFTSKSNRRNP